MSSIVVLNHATSRLFSSRWLCIIACGSWISLSREKTRNVVSSSLQFIPKKQLLLIKPSHQGERRQHIALLVFHIEYSEANTQASTLVQDVLQRIWSKNWLSARIRSLALDCCTKILPRRGRLLVGIPTSASRGRPEDQAKTVFKSTTNRTRLRASPLPAIHLDKTFALRISK